MVILNPYARNLDLTNSNDAKLFSKATAGSTKKFDLTNKTEEAEDFKLLIEEAARIYAWGESVSDVPVEWEANRVTHTRSLLIDFRSFSLKEGGGAGGRRREDELPIREEGINFIRSL